jgi:hypothetical protein
MAHKQLHTDASHDQKNPERRGGHCGGSLAAEHFWIVGFPLEYPHWVVFSQFTVQHNLTKGASASSSSTSPVSSRKESIMKTVGIVLLIVGLVMTLYSGFSYVTKEKVVDLGELEITADNQHNVNWQPYVGLGIAVVGGVILLLGRKKS